MSRFPNVVGRRWPIALCPRPALVAVAIALLGLAAAGCGGASAAHRVVSARALERDTSDQDGDSVDSGHYDRDDANIVDEGHRAGASEWKAIVALVKRWYATAAAGDGARGCALVYGYLLVSETASEVKGRQSSPALSGRMCALVLSRLFGMRRRELAAHAATLHVTDIRLVDRTDGVVLLRFGPGREHLMYARRVDGVWKMALVFEDGMA